jgi:hypothetical protein
MSGAPTIQTTQSGQSSADSDEHAERNRIQGFRNPLSRALPVLQQQQQPVASVESAWTLSTTGYKDPAHAPQFLLRPSANATVLITLTPLAKMHTSFAVAVMEADGLRIGKYTQKLRDAFSAFSYEPATCQLPLRAGGCIDAQRRMPRCFSTYSYGRRQWCAPAAALATRLA